MKRLQSSLFVLVVLTYFLIVWGAVVRSSGSGLGCPDWPLCFGQIIPPFRKDVLIEYCHRLLASLVGFITLGIGIVILRKREWRKKWGKPLLFALLLLFIQIYLGAVTVKTELHPHIVATHLGMALIFFSLLLHLFLKIRLELSPPENEERRTKNNFLIFVFIPLLFLQIVLGGLVAASGGGLACPDFPTCQGVWWPTLKGTVGFHWMHRLLAYLIFALLSWMAFRFWKIKNIRHLFLFGCLQILLGVGNIVLGLPFLFRVAHLAVAVLLWMGALHLARSRVS